MAVGVQDSVAALFGGADLALDVLQTALDRVPVGVALLEPIDGGRDFRYLYANPANRALKPGAPVVGSTYRTVWPELADFAIPRLRHVFETGQPWGAEDSPLEVELRPGVPETRYYTFEASRITVDRRIVVLDRSLETTAEVESRMQAALAQERLEMQLQRTELLRETAAASLVLDTTELGSSVLEMLRRSLGLRAGVLYLLDLRTRLLHNVAIAGYPEEARPLFDQVALDERSVSGRSVMNDEAVVVRYEELPPGTKARADAAGETESLWVVLPAHAAGIPIGNLTLVFDEERRISDEDLALFRTLADQLGVAMWNASLYEREREAANFGAALARIDHDTHSSLEVQEVVRSALRQGAEAMGAQSAAIDGIEDGRWVVWYDWGFQPSIVGEIYTDQQNPHGVAAARTGETIAIEDAFNDPRVDNETMKAIGLRSAIVAPLIVRSEPIAALYYNYHHSTHHFTDAQIDFVRKVASSLSLAIENARLYQSERDIADRLQDALLALPDEIPGVEFAHAYRSATEAARVGGDFYDLFPIGGDLVAITVGDVAGKGLAASALTSLVKNAIRAHATEKGATPGHIITLTNELVYNATTPDSFVTAFFGVYDCVRGRLVYSSAGHTTGMLLDDGGDVELLPSTGPVLGAFPDMVFDQAESVMRPDRLLFLYTDGLTEARADGPMFGDSRLTGLLRRLGGQRPAEVIRTVIEEVLSFAGGSLGDDVAVLAVRPTASGQRAPRSQEVEV